MKLISIFLFKAAAAGFMGKAPFKRFPFVQGILNLSFPTSSLHKYTVEAIAVHGTKDEPSLTHVFIWRRLVKGIFYEECFLLQNVANCRMTLFLFPFSMVAAPPGER